MIEVMRKLASVLFALALPGFGQSINSGTVSGTVSDPSGAVIAGAEVRISNAVTGFNQTATTDTSGAYRFNSVPLNNYRMTVSVAGFAPATQDADVHSTLPTTVNFTLTVAAESTTVVVQAEGAQVETDPSTHQDVDRNSFLKLPSFDPGGALNQAITYSTGAVAADANGFFHPVGDHAQVGYVIDGYPISDQQSKIFSTQIPLNALQSMELITGSPDAQYGDKTSLVVNATTRSGLGATKPFGSVESGWGSFGTLTGNASLGFGTPEVRKLHRLERRSLRATSWTRPSFCPSTTSGTTAASSTASTGNLVRRMSSIWISSPRATGFRSPTITINWPKIRSSAC